MVCYNFMPVFDWTRTELDRVREDGSTVLAYNQDAIDSMDPEKMFDAIKDDMNGTVMPGWEPERMAKSQGFICTYIKDIDEDQLFENLKYFLEAIMPVCDKYDINMAIHPDDPGMECVRSAENHFITGKIKTNDGYGAKQTQRCDILHGLVWNKLK